jgi:hypothetical protein
VYRVGTCQDALREWVGIVIVPSAAPTFGMSNDLLCHVLFCMICAAVHHIH